MDFWNQVGTNKMASNNNAKAESRRMANKTLQEPARVCEGGGPSAREGGRRRGGLLSEGEKDVARSTYSLDHLSAEGWWELEFKSHQTLMAFEIDGQLEPGGCLEGR